eukprot:13884463-Ditylum_brightwellii.AAC.1
MTANEIVNWRREKGILKHWILPEQGLNKEPRHKISPTDNAPKFNALDCNYNCNVHYAVQEHISHTDILPHTNAHTFSLTMGWKAGTPSSKMILDDMAQILNYYISKRIQARGAV